MAEALRKECVCGFAHAVADGAGAEEVLGGHVMEDVGEELFGEGGEGCSWGFHF